MNNHSLVRRRSSLLSSTVDDDLVLFSAEQGKYYGTQLVGHRIWSLLEHEASVTSICERLVEEFAVDSTTCERETSQFIQRLAEEGLVTIR